MYIVYTCTCIVTDAHTYTYMYHNTNMYMYMVKLRTGSHGVSTVEHVTTFLNSACTVAVVYLKVAKVRRNL